MDPLKMIEDVFPGEHVYIPLLMLMEEIPNNHLGRIKPVVNNGISTG